MKGFLNLINSITDQSKTVSLKKLKELELKQHKSIGFAKNSLR